VETDFELLFYVEWKSVLEQAADFVSHMTMPVAHTEKVAMT